MTSATDDATEREIRHQLAAANLTGATELALKVSLNAASPALTQAGAIMGKPLFMAPELARGVREAAMSVIRQAIKELHTFLGYLRARKSFAGKPSS